MAGLTDDHERIRHHRLQHIAFEFRTLDELGDASRKGILRTFRPSKNHSTKIKRSRTRLQLVLRENWCWDPLLCAGGSAFLMRCLRTPFREETTLLSVRKIPFLEASPASATRYCAWVVALAIARCRHRRLQGLIQESGFRFLGSVTCSAFLRLDVHRESSPPLGGL